MTIEIQPFPFRLTFQEALDGTDGVTCQLIDGTIHTGPSISACWLAVRAHFAVKHSVEVDDLETNDFPAMPLCYERTAYQYGPLESYADLCKVMRDIAVKAAELDHDVSPALKASIRNAR